MKSKRQNHAKREGAADYPINPQWWHFALIASAALACYIQATKYGFVWDDLQQVLLNPRIRSFSNLGQAFSENFWAFRSQGYFSNYYRPLQTLMYMIGYALGGLSPSAYHWVSIVLHVLATVGAYWVGLELLRSNTVALSGALLFAAHPMHTESVTWIAGITDVGCALFYFCALAAYIRHRRSRAHRKPWLVLSLTSFLLALLFKEMALTFPLILWVADAALDRTKSTWGERFKRLLPFVLPFLAYCVLRMNALGVFARTVQSLPLEPPDRILTLLYLTGRYIQNLVAPVSHSAFHVFRPVSWMTPGEWLAPALILPALVGLVWILWRRDRHLGLLAAWPVLTLIPVLNLGGVGQNVYAERYLYIPSLGLCLLLASGIHRCLKGWGLLASGGIVIVFSVLTIWRNPVWRDERALYASTLSVSPGSVPFHNSFGRILLADKDYSGASREYRSALEWESKSFIRSAREAGLAFLGLSAVADAQGNPAEALRDAETAYRLLPNSPEACLTLGSFLARFGKYTEAEKLLRQVLLLQPGNAPAHINLGNVYLARGDLSTAEREFRTSIQHDPTWTSAQLSMALLLVRTNRASEAMPFVRQALALDPSNAQARQLMVRLSTLQKTE